MINDIIVGDLWVRFKYDKIEYFEYFESNILIRAPSRMFKKIKYKLPMVPEQWQAMAALGGGRIGTLPPINSKNNSR